MSDAAGAVPRADAHPYGGACFALLSMHGKAAAIAQPLWSVLGAGLQVVDDFDTDTLGTFTREVPRAGSQCEAAVRKARIAIERSGLGSEGAFGPGPLGFGAWNAELVAFVDRARGIEVVGCAHGPGLHVHGLASTPSELRDLASLARFPSHGLVVRPDGESDPRIRKGIASWEELDAAFAEALACSATGAAFVESDLRAHFHPSRMALIGRAALDLAGRLSTPCPACRCPGFGAREAVPGLPCAQCGAPTVQPVGILFGCVRRDCRELRRDGTSASADPGTCDSCNP